MLTKRQTLLAAGFGSACIHAVLLLVAGWIMMRYPPGESSPPPEEQMPFEMVKTEPPEPEAAPPPEHPVVENSALEDVAHPPDDADFQGARNSVAGSTGPAKADKPLPNQQGRQAPVYAFDPSPQAAPAPPMATPPATVPPPPAPTRQAIQPPIEHVTPTLVHNEMVMLNTEPAPPPDELNPYDPSFRSTMPPPPVPVRRSTPPPAYRPLEAQTASSGSITTAGPTGVNAVATPYARYVNTVVITLRTVWKREIDARSDIAALGSVRCHIAVDRTGHVHAPRILSNSANEALASIALDAVTTAPIPPIPPDVVETMNGAMLQLDFTFECL